MSARHYCTYFDQGFLIQGLALARSLLRHDPAAVLWVLALDEVTAEVMRQRGGPEIRVIALAELERGDRALVDVKPGRSMVEYYFTLSPSWPLWLLKTQPDIDRLTYLDADLFFFDSPDPIFAAMDQAHASVLLTEHRFPSWLRHYERHGRFNVGVLAWRNDSAGRACLEDWRKRCLEWCFDRLESGRYADQKYLDAWPERFGAALLVLAHPGVNVAPWNWMTNEEAAAAPIVFHFARFRPRRSERWWRSGQLDYGVMPRRLRRAIYGPYVRALEAARAEIRTVRPGFDFPRQGARSGRDFWRGLPLRVLLGGDWLRVGDGFYNLRFGLGRWSGHFLATARRIFLRAQRTSESASQGRQRTGEK